MKAIIPCAGYGTRVGMRPDESKEMLFLNGEGAPCIDYALKKCKDLDLEPLIVTRREKTDLIDYCRNLGIHTVVLSPKREWADTVYASAYRWDEENVLILPDTRWSNEKALKTLINSPQPLAIGCHSVFDPENWGILSGEYIIEKPKHLTGPHLAWGIIKFSDHAGQEFFRDMKDSHMAKVRHCDIVNLGSFKDLTRVKL